MSEDRKIIYLDNAATTRTSPKVVEEMLPFFSEYYGNPSSVYEFSNASKKAVAQARQVIADSLGAKPQGASRTTGQLRRRRKPIRRKGGILLPVKSSTMQSFTPVSIWKAGGFP